MWGEHWNVERGRGHARRRRAATGATPRAPALARFVVASSGDNDAAPRPPSARPLDRRATGGITAAVAVSMRGPLKRGVGGGGGRWRPFTFGCSLSMLPYGTDGRAHAVPERTTDVRLVS